MSHSLCLTHSPCLTRSGTHSLCFKVQRLAEEFQAASSRPDHELEADRTDFLVHVALACSMAYPAIVQDMLDSTSGSEAGVHMAMELIGSQKVCSGWGGGLAVVSALAVVGVVRVVGALAVESALLLDM